MWTPSFRLFCSNCITLLTIIFLAVRNVHADFSMEECNGIKHCIIEKCENPNDLRTCEYIFSYRHEKGTNFVEMELLTRRSNSDTKYIAVAFSHDQQMVCFCFDLFNPSYLIEILYFRVVILSPIALLDQMVQKFTSPSTFQAIKVMFRRHR